MKVRLCLLAIVLTLSTIISFGKGRKNNAHVLFSPGNKSTVAAKFELKLWAIEFDTAVNKLARLVVCDWDTAGKVYAKSAGCQSIDLNYYPYLDTTMLSYDTIVSLKTYNYLFAKAVDDRIFKKGSMYPYLGALDTLITGKTINNSYIRYVDLSRLAKRREGSTIYIDTILRFEHCILDTVACSDTTVKMIVFDRALEFRFCTISILNLTNCIFKGNVNIVKPIVNDNFSFEGSQFDSGFIIRFNYVGWFNSENSKQTDTMAAKLFKNGYDEQEINFKNCVFNGRCNIFNDVRFYKLRFNSSHFNEVTSFSRVRTRKKRAEENDAAKNDVYELWNIDLSNTLFNDTASFYRERLRNINLKAAYFKSVLNLFETVFIDSTDKAFSQSRFGNDTDVICILRPENFYISNLKFNWVSVDRITFPFVDDTGGIMTLKSNAVLEGENIENIEKYYGALKEQAKGYYSKQDEVYGTLAQKYERQKMLYQMRYYWHEKDWRNYFAIAIPEFFVRNGYEGEGQFFMITILTILLFAFLYFFFCKKEMIKYFNAETGVDDGDASTGKKHHISFKTYFKGLWLSAIMLISPQFPKKYFKINGLMFAFVVAEWLIGLVMIILFFMFIAGHYPIVKTLIGI